MNAMCSIYGLLEPVTQKLRYVGKTVQPLRQRLTNHVADSNRHETWVGRWIRKHGVPGIVELDRVLTAESCDHEKRVIKLFRDLGYGLTNITDGGDGGKGCTPEMRKRLSEAHKGKVQSPETIAKRAAANRGQKRTKETRERMSRARMGMKFSDEHRKNIGLAQSKPVICVNTGQMFCSGAEAANHLGLNPECVANVAAGKAKQTRGFRFVRYTAGKEG